MLYYNYMANDEKKEAKPLDAETDVLLKTRTILLSGEINKDTADSTIKKLLLLEADNSNEPIWLYINSPGGEVDSGFAIYDMIRFVKPEVKILGIGLIASAAALIFVSVPFERRFALPHSSYLIHQPLASMKGVASDVEIYADKLNRIKKEINKVIADATGKTEDEVALHTDRDYWLTADEAIKYGLVSKILDRRP